MKGTLLKTIKEAFPSLIDRLNTDNGLLHLEMHVFTDFINHQIDKGDRDTVAKCYEIADHYLKNGNTALVNAIHVSLLEHLNLADGKVKRRWAWDIMPDGLRQGYNWIMAQNSKLLNKQRPTSR